MAKISKWPGQFEGSRADRNVVFSADFLENSRYAKIAYHVAKTMETVNINELTTHPVLTHLVTRKDERAFAVSLLISWKPVAETIVSSWKLCSAFRSWTVTGGWSEFVKWWTNYTNGSSPMMTWRLSRWVRPLSDADLSHLSAGIRRFLWFGNSQHASIWERSSFNGETERCFRSFVLSRHRLGRRCSTSRSDFFARSESTSSLFVGIQRHDSHRWRNGSRQYSNVRRIGSAEEISHSTRNDVSIHVEREEELSTGHLSQLATCLQRRSNDVLHVNRKRRDATGSEKSNDVVRSRRATSTRIWTIWKASDCWSPVWVTISIIEERTMPFKRKSTRP